MEIIHILQDLALGPLNVPKSALNGPKMAHKGPHQYSAVIIGATVHYLGPLRSTKDCKRLKYISLANAYLPLCFLFSTIILRLHSKGKPSKK